MDQVQSVSSEEHVRHVLNASQILLNLCCLQAFGDPSIADKDELPTLVRKMIDSLCGDSGQWVLLSLALFRTHRFINIRSMLS